MTSGLWRGARDPGGRPSRVAGARNVLRLRALLRRRPSGLQAAGARLLAPAGQGLQGAGGGATRVLWARSPTNRPDG